jgi:uncharacterized protein
VILLDTSGLLANYDRRDHHYTEVVRVLARPQRRILSPFVLAELDYLVAQIAGQSGELVLLRDVARGAYQLESFSGPNIAAAIAVIERYADLHLGLADASIVVLAERYECHDILTLDERHFRAIIGPNGKPFRLLPKDA